LGGARADTIVPKNHIGVKKKERRLKRLDIKGKSRKKNLRS